MFGFAVFSLANDQTGKNENIFQDTDQDGLSNEEEKVYGTDPNESDTDHDGYTDATELKSGYNPLKPAPGDKLIDQENTDTKSLASTTNTASSETKPATEENLTQDVSEKVAAIIQEHSTNKAPLSLDELRKSIQDTLNNKITLDDIPEVDKESIKIKKQAYSKYSEEEQQKRMKEDTLEYVTAVSYVFANNSPKTLHSTNDINDIFSSLASNPISLLSGSDTETLQKLSEQGTKVMDQLQSIEVPENMLETHMKALKIATYAIAIKDLIQNNSNDPLAQITSLAYAQGLISVMSEFSLSVQDKLTQYGIEEIPIDL